MTGRQVWGKVTSVSVNGAILEEGTDYIIDSGTNTLTLLNARSDLITLTIDESHTYKINSLPPPKPEKHYLKLKNDYQKRRR